MSDKKILRDDKMIENKLIEISNILGISVNELIYRYVRRGLFIDDYYKPPVRTWEELREMSLKEIERDKKRGIFPKKNKPKHLVVD